MEKKKKIAIGVTVAILVVAITGVGIYFTQKNGSDKSNQAYVEKVGVLNGSVVGNVNRFAGVIEAQDTWKVNVSGDKEVKEVYVQVGDTVAEGDKLFSYNTDDVSSQIAQARLEVESMTNEINDANAQIAALAAERDAAISEEARFDYVTQIQSVENDLKQTEYDLKAKQLEISEMNKTVAESVVTSKMSGVVKSVSDINNPTGDGMDGSFMTILANGSYRVKCYVNEQNMAELSEGLPMLIRSRVDNAKTWSGTLAKIDTGEPQSNSNMDEYMEENSSDTTSSSKYPFYIALENTDGMMLGQHVFVEVDNGQESEKKGVYLYESYIVKEKESAYVWVDNGKGKLEKRVVELGEYDEELGEYEIKSGLKMDDYVAWPQAGLKEGMKTTKDASDAMENQGEETVNESGEEEVTEEMPTDGGISEEELIEDVPEDETLEREEQDNKVLKEL